MKRCLFALLAVFLVTGCASGTKRTFTVITDPPDAEIKLISGKDQRAQTYRSPAEVTARIPEGGDRKNLTKLVVSRSDYKPKEIVLASVAEGYVFRIKLDKVYQYRLTYRLMSPVQSEELKFEDKIISVSFAVNEQTFQMNLKNLTRLPFRILWERSEYNDVTHRQLRLMHSGIKYQDRSNPIPSQLVAAGGDIRLAVMPVNAVYYSKEKNGYELKPLFSLDTDAALDLKGRTFYLFLPIEIDRQIIPYNFKFEISDVVKQ